MAVTYGFYNSLNGDRVYDAVAFSEIFNGIINDGVFMSIGGKLMVSPNGGMTVKVASGRAWFNGTWTQNDTDLVLTHDAAPVALSRIDSVILEVDSSSEVRANSIKILTGTPASSPVAPTLTDTEYVHQYSLANVLIGPEVTSILVANITNKVGTSSTPFVTAVLETMDVDALLAQWGDQFDNWFTDLQNELDSNQVTNLQNQINALETGTGLSVKGRSVNTNGNIADILASVDGHVLRRLGSSIGFGPIVSDGLSDNSVILSKLANNSVNGDKIVNGSIDNSKIGLRVPTAIKRVGGSSTSWGVGGTTVYDISKVTIQFGTINYGVVDGNGNGNQMLVFPVAFYGSAPLIFLTAYTDLFGGEAIAYVRVGEVGSEMAQIRVKNLYPSAQQISVMWLAIGPIA